MTAALLRMPWELRRSEPFVRYFQVIDENGAAVPITGQTITATIRAGRTYDSTLKATLTVETVDAASGQFLVRYTQGQVTLLAATSFLGYGQVWITGSSFPDGPRQIVEAYPVSVV